MIISSVALTALVGCGTRPLQRSQVDSIKLGESKEQVAEKFGKSLPKVMHVFESQNTQYRAEHFDLQTGSTQSGTVVCTPMCMYIPITVPVFSQFAVIYKELANSVLSFGLLEQLSKSENPEVSSIMPDLKASYEKALTAKKR